MIIQNTPSGVTINAAGRRGKDAKSPQNDHISSQSTLSSPRGNRGANGLDAGPAEDGENGGLVTLTLSRPGQGNSKEIESPSTAVQIKGTVRDALSRQRDFCETFSLSPTQSISVDVRGGDGGKGGNGADGEDGEEGTPGFNATELSHATPGGRGGDGGDAGAGSCGGNAGSGGKVVFQVNSRDTNLLMLLGEISCASGSPGSAGKHGKPGAGGAGGKGGQGLSSIDRGNRPGHSPQTSVSKPPGPNGNPGRTGAVPRFNLRDGQPGHPGAFSIIVYDNLNFAREFRAPYDLQLVSCEWRLASPWINDDGILEPGETITLHNIFVKNTGQMPTPDSTAIFVYLAEQPTICNLVPQGGRLVCNYSIAPGEISLVCGELTFEIAECAAVRDTFGVCCKGTLPLHFGTLVEGTGRGFTSFFPSNRCPAVTIEVDDPVVFKRPLPPVASICVGENMRIPLGLFNNSNCNLGTDSSCGRAVKIRVRFLDGRIPAQNIFIGNQSDIASAVSLGQSGALEFNIPFLPAKLAAASNSLEDEHSLWVCLQQVIPYIESSMEVELAIQSLKNPSEMRTIIRQKILLRSTLRYRKSQSSTFLLVVNLENTFEEIEAWKSVTAKLGQTGDIWDLNQQGHFSLSVPDSNSNNMTLMQEWKNKFIIVLANTFQSSKSALDFLSGQEFIQAISEPFNIRFYFFCEQGLDIHRVIYKSFPKRGGTYSAVVSPDQIAHKMEHELPGGVARFTVSKGIFSCCTSSDSIVEGKCKSIVQKAKNSGSSLGNARFLFVSGKEDHKNSVQVIRLLDVAQRGSRYFWLSSHSVHSLEVIRGENNIFALCAILPFERKIEILLENSEIWSKNFDLYAKSIVKTICMDLLHEALWVFGALEPTELANASNVRGKMILLEAFIFKSNALNSLFYEKCKLWDTLSSGLLTFLSGTKWLLQRDYSGSKKTGISAYYQMIEALVTSNFAKFINYDFKDTIVEYLNDGAIKNIMQSYSRSSYAKIDSESRAAVMVEISPMLVNVNFGRESEFWTTCSQYSLHQNLFEALTKGL